MVLKCQNDSGVLTLFREGVVDPRLAESISLLRIETGDSGIRTGIGERPVNCEDIVSIAFTYDIFLSFSGDKGFANLLDFSEMLQSFFRRSEMSEDEMLEGSDTESSSSNPDLSKLFSREAWIVGEQRMFCTFWKWFRFYFPFLSKHLLPLGHCSSSFSSLAAQFPNRCASGAGVRNRWRTCNQNSILWSFLSFCQSNPSRSIWTSLLPHHDRWNFSKKQNFSFICWYTGLRRRLCSIWRAGCTCDWANRAPKVSSQISDVLGSLEASHVAAVCSMATGNRVRRSDQTGRIFDSSTRKIVLLTWIFRYMICMLSSSNGRAPTKRVYSRMPIDQTSASFPLYGSPCMSSGAAYAGDPQHVSKLCLSIRPFSVLAQSPKSISFRWRSSVRSRFSGFRSRWA